LKTLILGTLFFLLSGCALVGLAATAISATVKIVENLLRITGSILKDDDVEKKRKMNKVAY
jgi:hypothetical protein